MRIPNKQTQKPTANANSISGGFPFDIFSSIDIPPQMNLTIDKKKPSIKKKLAIIAKKVSIIYLLHTKSFDRDGVELFVTVLISFIWNSIQFCITFFCKGLCRDGIGIAHSTIYL